MIRLYTDAGLKKGLATWATVALVDGQLPIELSGRLRDRLDCTATAECRAIANALHQLVRAGHAPAGTAVTIYSDSRHAVDRINGALVRRPTSPAAKAVAMVLKLAASRGISISATWVPGHKPDDHSEHAPWNNRCDKLCRDARKGVASAPMATPAAPRFNPDRKPSSVARRLSAGLIVRRAS